MTNSPTVSTGTNLTQQAMLTSTGNLANYQPISTNQPIHFQIQPATTTAVNLNPTYGFDSQQLLPSTGTSFNPNNPYLPPPVPTQCLTKIKNMEYVDFGTLLTSILPNSLNMASIIEGADDEEFCLSQIPTLGAAATFRKKSRRNAITNFPTWVMAWNVFYETTLHFFPGKHHELFSYFKHICEYAIRHKFNFLVAYDKAHRIHIAAQRNLPLAVQTSSWTKHCPSLYNLYLKDNMTSHCSNCLGWGHYEKQCPLTQNNANNSQTSTLNPLQTLSQPPSIQQPSNLFRNDPQQSSKSGDNSSCFRYNKGYVCNPPCEYPHVCKACLKKGSTQLHPAYQCKNNKERPGSNTTTTRFRPNH